MGILHFNPLPVLHTSPSTASRLERWIERESAPIPRQRETEERRRWRNRPSSPVGNPLGLPSDRWCVVVVKTRESMVEGGGRLGWR
ncbi:hypothetical protein HanPSC8_Chr06g0243331 [Helianthus annuus]|nr:hypothetical protein HanPSC8_Chr06g0243331 [Helianthus annuus]